MTHFSSELSTGLIVKSNKIWRWQLNLIVVLVEAKLINVTAIIVQGSKPPLLPANIAYLHKLDSIVFRSPMKAYELVDLNIPDAGVFDSIENDAGREVFSDIDLLINFSEVLVSSELKKVAKIGLLETHFSQQGSPESLSSVGFGFDEFARGAKQCYFSVMGFTPNQMVYTLSESYPSLDSGSLSRNLNQYWALLESTWVSVCQRLQTQTLLQARYKSATENKPLGIVDTPIYGGNAYKHLASTFIDKLHQKFFRKEQWVLLLQFQNQASSQIPLSFADYTEISPPDDCFWADPFVISEKGRHFIFFEELPFVTERGHLSCMEVFDDGRHLAPRVILKKPYHLSYPNVFKYESEYYMIPESGDTGFVSLYRSAEFPYHWEYKHDLMSGLCAYDSTLIKHDGVWWLFACVAAKKGMSGCEELHIFSADSPLSQSWAPHQLNPIISDASLARPAGKFFERDGVLYRPSQDCAGSYGAGLNINKVKMLTKDSYVEELVHCARPTWDNKLTALHTLNFNQHVSVADAMRVDSRCF